MFAYLCIQFQEIFARSDIGHVAITVKRPILTLRLDRNAAKRNPGSNRQKDQKPVKCGRKTLVLPSISRTYFSMNKEPGTDALG
jgi:hypothetical protein